ncbi:MAG TPA: hypothetical protein VGC91_19545 [Pyrinomonadaceae bacterium]|jgi:hypothetical protein
MPTTKARKSTKKAAKKGASKARASTGAAAARPKMSAETKKQLAKGRKLTVQVKRQADFDTLVRELKRRLVIDPGIVVGNPRGCFPCHSGLDFIVIGEEVINPG